MIKNYEKIKACLAWSAQQGYVNAEESAEELGKVIHQEMYCDQPYYSAWAWKPTNKWMKCFNRPRDKEEKNTCKGELQFSHEMFGWKRINLCKHHHEEYKKQKERTDAVTRMTGIE